jgi:hypothetical protein
MKLGNYDDVKTYYARASQLSLRKKACESEIKLLYVEIEQEAHKVFNIAEEKVSKDRFIGAIWEFTIVKDKFNYIDGGKLSSKAIKRIDEIKKGLKEDIITIGNRESEEVFKEFLVDMGKIWRSINPNDTSKGVSSTEIIKVMTEAERVDMNKRVKDFCLIYSSYSIEKGKKLANIFKGFSKVDKV